MQLRTERKEERQNDKKDHDERREIDSLSTTYV
jgi:hypothetical protein